MSGFRKKQTVLRVSGGYYDDDGMWKDGTEEEITIMASVQPLNETEMSQYAELRPSGTSRFNAVKIYASEPLRPVKQELPDDEPMQEADILIWRGRRWKVAACFDWQSDVINHFRMIAWEVEPGAKSDTEVSS